MTKFSDAFKLHKLDKASVAKPKGDCKCGKKNQRMVKGVCNKCYQAEYGKKRKAERQQYIF